MKTIEKKIKAAQERIHRLQKLAQSLSSFQDYATSPDIKDIAERNIQVAIESCLDIGKIIIANNQYNEPKDNKGIFLVLADEKIISNKILAFLIPMAGTRNILVHGYDKIDDTLIYGILNAVSLWPKQYFILKKHRLMLLYFGKNLEKIISKKEKKCFKPKKLA